MRLGQVVPLAAAVMMGAAACGREGTGDNSTPAQQVPQDAQPNGGTQSNAGGDTTSGTRVGSSTTVDTSTHGLKSGGDTAKTAGRP